MGRDSRIFGEVDSPCNRAHVTLIRALIVCNSKSS